MKIQNAEKVMRLCVIVARFNELITKELLAGALDEIHTIRSSEIVVDVVWVPGCFEIPVLGAKSAAMGIYDGIIALGCVIKGETSHFDFVAGPCASGLMNISISSQIPVVFGVLTTDTMEQALSRVGLKHGHKGREAAHTCMSTIQALTLMDSKRKLTSPEINR